MRASNQNQQEADDVDKIWLKSYQQDVPHDIDSSEYASLADLFDKSCELYADKIAYSNMNSQISYQTLNQLSCQFSVFLQKSGLKKGARVALMMPNILQYPIALFGILRAGFTVVNVNPLYTPDELTHQMNDAQAEVILVMANFAHTVEKALPNMPYLKHIIITQMGDVFPVVKREIVNAVVKYLKKMIPPYSIPQAITFQQVMHEGRGHSCPRPVTLTHDDIAFIQYTGGTTGISKGAMLTHGNMLANVLQASAWLSPLSLGSNDIIITALPLYHIFSLTANCLTFFKAGAKNILITNPRDVTGFINEIKNAKFTAITGVNTLFNTLLNHPAFDTINFSKLKLALSGGMALQKSVSEHWHERTKAPILEAYGLTETSPAVTINPLYLTEFNGSIGLPLPSTQVSLRDADGRELPLGQQGELCVKGPQVMPGYWQHEAETARTFWPDGYLRTGDVAIMDEQGFVYLVDRIKDMILVSGFNVYPNEIEQVIGQLPGVLEVGVVGVMGEDGTEKVKACVVKKDPSLTAEDIIAYTRGHLTAYKVPKIIEFYSDLPKTNVGKILRRALKL